MTFLKGLNAREKLVVLSYLIRSILMIAVHPPCPNACQTEGSSPRGTLIEHRGRRIRHGRGWADAPRTEAIPRGSALPSGRRMIEVRVLLCDSKDVYHV
jgi:hypothetical protein